MAIGDIIVGIDVGTSKVSLVVTIIILLILAGITIGQLTNSGLFENAKIAKGEYENAQTKEEDILKQYENAINSGEIISDRDIVTLTQEQYDTLMNKIEKVENIQISNNISGSNTTLNYDFSKYKRIRCYAKMDAVNSILDVDLYEINNNINYYTGGISAAKEEGDSANVFVCTVHINPEKSQLTLAKIGFISGTTFNDRKTTSAAGNYYIYKIEGIY